MAKYKETAIVLSQEQLSEDIFSMWIQTSHIAKKPYVVSSFPFIQKMGQNFCLVQLVFVK